MSRSMHWIYLPGLLALLSIQTGLAWTLLRRLRVESRRNRKLHLALAAHLVGEPLRRDPAFVRLLDDYRRSPRNLASEDRIRARSWLRSAARVYELSLDEIDDESASDWIVPSMGENRRLDELPTNEDLIDLDPEFLSFLDALRRS